MPKNCPPEETIHIASLMSYLSRHGYLVDSTDGDIFTFVRRPNTTGPGASITTLDARCWDGQIETEEVRNSKFANIKEFHCTACRNMSPENRKYNIGWIVTRLRRNGILSQIGHTDQQATNELKLIEKGLLSALKSMLDNATRSSPPIAHFRITNPIRLAVKWLSAST